MRARVWGGGVGVGGVGVGEDGTVRVALDCLDLEM